MVLFRRKYETIHLALSCFTHGLRNLCGDLLSPDFSQGLTVELESYVDVIAGLAPHLEITRRLDRDDGSLLPQQRAMIFRIGRTLLRNVVRHAAAQKLTVILTREKTSWLLRVEDNGKGFTVPENWESYKREKHYGMYMANTFAQSMGGTMTVTSKPGHGTRIDVRIPITT